MSQVVVQPEVTSSGRIAGRWMVVIFNNETNSMDEVVEILMEATKCDYEEAMIEMWEAHHFGKAPVHFSNREDCETVATIISSVGVQTEVVKEWND